MASDVQKFTSKRFLANIDLDLMRALFARHFADGDSPVAFGGDSAGVHCAPALLRDRIKCGDVAGGTVICGQDARLRGGRIGCNGEQRTDGRLR